MATAIQMVATPNQVWWAVMGSTQKAIAQSWVKVFHLASLLAGIEMPFFADLARKTLIQISRSVISTAGMMKLLSPWGRDRMSAYRAPKTIILSANGSRKAPERVVP